MNSAENVFKIGSTERGILVGQVGTGKSTLADYLIADKPSLFVIDPKGDFKLSRPGTIVTNPNQLGKMTDPVILYRPEPEFSDHNDYNEVFHWLYLRGNTFVYIDELTAVTGRSHAAYPLWLRSLYTQGRGKGIGILAATQRPANLPLFVFSESFRFWKFFLLMARDNHRMAEYMGNAVLHKHRDKHSFFFRDILTQRPAIEYVVRLAGK